MRRAYATRLRCDVCLTVVDIPPVPGTDFPRDVDTLPDGWLELPSLFRVPDSDTGREFLIIHMCPTCSAIPVGRVVPTAKEKWGPKGENYFT